jgi:protein SCO1/2
VPDVSIKTVQQGNVSLSRLWREKPVLLTLVFSRCAGVCSPFLRSLSESTARIGGAGEEYYVVVLSFDPDDTTADMQAMAATLQLQQRPGWIFGVGPPEEIRQLARATAFWFRPVNGTGQYNHPAMLIGIRKGRLVRLLVGATVEPPLLRLVIRELQGEMVPSYPLPDPKVPFRCFGYDPATGSSRLDWGMLVLLSPSLLAMMTVIGVFTMVRRDGTPL